MAIPTDEIDGFFEDEEEREAIANEGYPRPTSVQLRRAAPAAARPMTPSEIARAWSADGPLVRVPTGFATLDEACRGGLPVP